MHTSSHSVQIGKKESWMREKKGKKKSSGFSLDVHCFPKN